MKLRVIGRTPIWVLGNTDTLVRINPSGSYSSGKNLFDCSKWNDKNCALEFIEKFPELTLYKVMEMEDGNARSIIQFFQDQ